MGSSKMKETLNEFAQRQWTAKASRREEDQIPFVEYNSNCSTLNVPNRNVPERDVPPHSESSRDNRRHNIKCCIWLLVIFVILGVVVGLAVGLAPKRYSGNVTQDWEGPGANACGITSPGDDIVIISKSIFDKGRNGTLSSVCGHKIWAEGQGSDGSTIKGESLSLTVVGYCTKCGHGDLVVDPDSGAYQDLGDPDGSHDLDGVTAHWHWLKPVPKL